MTGPKISRSAGMQANVAVTTERGAELARATRGPAQTGSPSVPWVPFVELRGGRLAQGSLGTVGVAVTNDDDGLAGCLTGVELVDRPRRISE